MAFKYSNNWAWPGRTAFIYNIMLDTFFDWESGEKLSGYTTLSDIGFEWKLSSASSWNTYSIVKDENDLDTIDDLVDTVTDETEPVVFERFKPQYGHIYPCKVVVKGLTQGSSYDIRSYYKKGSAKTTYNSQTITLLSSDKQIVCTGFNFQVDRVPGDEQLVQNLEDACAEAVNELNMFVVSDYSFPVNIIPYTEKSWAEWSTKSFDYSERWNWGDYDRLFYTFFHEIGHDIMKMGERSGYYDFPVLGSIKFMEFAINVPNAYWIWAGVHNYPWLTDRLSYVGCCLTAAAYQVSFGE